jgi:TonB family protein
MLDVVRNKPVPLVLSILALSLNATVSVTQQVTEPVPVVTAASAPLYPPIARQAHIEGEVRLEVSTDYDHVLSISILSGQPMLARAAKENVATWHFRPDIRMKFTVTFRYRLVSVPEKLRCNTVNANSRVSMKLPADVDISTDELWVCEPTTTIRERQ